MNWNKWAIIGKTYLLSAVSDYAFLDGHNFLFLEEVSCFFFFMVAGTIELFEGTFSSSSFKVRPLQHNNKLWCKYEAATT